MSGHIISTLKNNIIFRRFILFIFFVPLFFGSTLSQAQELDEITLAKILSQSDSIRKTLIYTGVVKLQHHIQDKHDLLRVWRNKNKFYHHQSIIPQEEKERRSSSRKGFFDFGFMPEQKYIKLLLENYTVSFNEAKSIVGKKTMRLTIKPKKLPRFGLSIWFDKERFHILQREINYYQPESKVLILTMEYQNIQYDILPPDSLVNAQKKRSKNRERSKRPKRFEYKDLIDLKEKFDKPIYAPKFVPNGCELVSIKSTKDKHRDVLEMHYADGLLNLSMFQFWGKPPRFVERMLKGPVSEDENRLDFRQISAVKKGNLTFFWVGNFSVQQFKKMADSLIEYK